MTRFGLTLSSEEHPPERLVEIAQLAEASGFDFVSVSDHYHPWTDTQGHSPFVWAVLGAISATTENVEVAVGVTCPTIRIHPAILAQATATAARLLDGRFVWGVGSGEALNEHVLGDRWPPAPVRLEMLEEAIQVIRKLWAGGSVSHRGRHYQVENARVYDLPNPEPQVIVSAFGPQAAALAARSGDGLWVTGLRSKAISRWRDAGGSGPVYSQLSLCWGPDRAEALQQAHRIWPNDSLPGQLSQDLPTVAHFEQVTSLVTPEQIERSIPCGPDPGPVLASARTAIGAGVDHLYFHQIGPDQEGFCRFWERELRPVLTSGSV